jgi:LacI family transcriptional regulator
MSSPTVHEIAERLGLSAATVSRALSGHKYVKASTRERVLAAAAEVGYERNALARALRQEQSRLIGLIVPDTRSEVFAWVSAAIQNELHQHGYRVIFGQSGDSASTDEDYLRMFVQNRVDGIVHVPCTPAGAEVLKATASRPPIVELVRRSRGKNFDSFELDDRKGSRIVTEHLLELGHENICMIAGTPAASTTRNRVAGFREAIRKAGVDSSKVRILSGNYSHEWGVQAARRLRVDFPRCTAVFASSNQLASGALSGLRSMGLRVPADLSLVAFEDPVWFSSCEPGITTYAQSLDELGVLAARGILARIADGTAAGRAPVRARVAGSLVVRGSAAPLRKRRPGRSAEAG